VCLDIEVAIAMAPGLAKVIVYEASPRSGIYDDLLNRMADDDLAKQLSSSWFIRNGPADPVAEQIFQQMAAQGQSMFVASGDIDAYTGLIPFPSDSPNVIEVGGTELNTTGPLGNWSAEAVWNWNVLAGCASSPDVGSSGGISTQYVIPTWQTGIANSGNQGSTTMRNVPDVALTADNIFEVVDGGDICQAGTSAAAPLWAGFTALVNQQAAASGMAPVGFLNPALYAIGRGSSYSSDFHDITTANNESSGSPNQFSAVSGYDLCTGWGTPNSHLINDLTGSCLFTPVGALNAALDGQTATLLPNGLVLVAGGYNGSYLQSAELYDPATGSWTMTGSLNIPRTSHTATLLPSGQVLVAGGINQYGAVQSAELYDPPTARWYTGPPGLMNAARYNHTATLLPNGLVLVAGGLGTSGVSLNSAETYNPVTETWTADTYTMNVARELHTATLLPSGFVLVAAGFQTSGGVTAAAELYNPANGVWSPTGTMTTARVSHTATLLPNGLVLVAGGWAGHILHDTSTAELYNPATGSWTTTGSLNLRRQNHTATLLPDGLVLVTGGNGNNQSGSNIAMAELYNPATSNWTVTCSLNTGRENHTATLLANGFVLVAGGIGSSYLSSAEVYPISSAPPLQNAGWVNTGSLRTARYNHTATLLANSLVLVAGGLGTSGLLNSAETYNPANGNWTADTHLMNVAREYDTATLLPNGSVLAAGGQSQNGVIVNSAEFYDPVAQTWTATGVMHDWRELHTATLLPNGLVLVAGGNGVNGLLNSAELYNPANHQWATTGPMNSYRWYHTATLLPRGPSPYPMGVVLVAGGIDNGTWSSAELYDASAQTWTTTASLNTGRRYHTQTLLPNGMVLVTGGQSQQGTVLNTAELYDPIAQTWTVTGPLNIARQSHTATVLPNGLVLVAGGSNGNNQLNSVELYDLPTGTWTIISSPLNLATEFHTATLLPNGSVLVAGGQGPSGILNNAEYYNP
jgi:N-acetylneuraminic acid mutarotase